MPTLPYSPITTGTATLDSLGLADPEPLSEEGRVVRDFAKKVVEHILRSDEIVYDYLGEGMSRDGKLIWAATPNPFLQGRRPIDVLWAGGLEEVLAAAEQYLEGDFA